MNAVSADFAYDRTLNPAVLLFGDDARRLERLGDAIAARGGRLVGQGPLAGAPERLEQQASTVRVVLDIGEDRGALLDALLERLDAVARSAGRLSVLVLAPPALIDVAAARVTDPGVALLIDPEMRDIEAALSVLLAPSPRHVAEGDEVDGRMTSDLSDEMDEIALALETMAAEGRGEAPSAHPVDAAQDGQLIRAILRLRRLRGQHFRPTLFADPAWDILLDLTVARIERRRVAASSLCIAAAVPATTALRWIAQMTAQHLLTREPDPDDGRRVFIALTDRAVAMMDAFLASARRIIAPVG